MQHVGKEPSTSTSKMHKLLIYFKSLFLRYKNEITTIMLVSFSLTLIFIAFYPGEKLMQDMVRFLYDSALAGLFYAIDTDSPGWMLWTTLIISFVMYYIVAFSGIFLGAKITPTEDDDGIEAVLAHTSFSVRRLYLRNILGAVLSLILILIPLYAIIVLLSLTQGSLFISDELAYSFIIFLIAGIFFLSLTSMISVLRFSKPIGKIAAFGYLIFEFIIDLMSSNKNYESFANLSISHYLSPVEVIYSGLTQENFWEIYSPSLVILSTSVLFIVIGTIWIKYPDYIERTNEVNNNNIHPLRTRLRFLDSHSRLAQRYPIFTDQLRRNLKVMFVLTIIILLQQYGLMTSIPDAEDLLTVINQSNTPIYMAFSHKHPFPASTLGFIALKFYSGLWLFYGLPVALIAARIPTRDVLTKTHDNLYSNNIKLEKIVFSRIMALFVSFTIYVWCTFLGIRLLQSITHVDFAFHIQISIFLILWLHYFGAGILLVGIAMLPKISVGNKVAIYVYLVFVLLAIISFLNPAIEWLRWFSYFTYFDPIGFIVEEVSFLPQFSVTLGLLAGSVIFTYIVTKYMFSKKDLR